jgi:hypothetical protein
LQHIQCVAQIAKVIISEDGKFTKGEIEFANQLLVYSWNHNVTDFLHMVAGVTHADINIYDKSLAALTFYDKGSLWRIKNFQQLGMRSLKQDATLVSYQSRRRDDRRDALRRN